MDSRVLSGATIRWRARRDVERRVKDIRTMHSERLASQCRDEENSEETQTECTETAIEAVIENNESDREDDGRLWEEDVVAMDTSHFDQQAFSLKFLKTVTRTRILMRRLISLVI